MRREKGVIQIVLFLMFLRIRVYYGVKLMMLIRRSRLINYGVLSIFGLRSLVIRVLVILVLLNIHIRLVIGVKYDVVDFKFLVYLIILFYLIINWFKIDNFIFMGKIFSVLLRDQIIVLWLKKFNLLDIKFYLLIGNLVLFRGDKGLILKKINLVN